jgi:tRNA pseudouridine13 synthase
MGEAPRLDLSLPYITPDIPGIGGRIKARPEHFVVEEIPLYEPSGVGDHLYVSVTKTEATTRDVQLELAELFGLKPEDVGKAGLKDRNAVTTQTFSVNLQGAVVAPDEAKRIIEDGLGVKVNWASYHGHKLRAGHLRGNRFTVTVTDLGVSLSHALELIGQVSGRLNLHGLPNYYGEQRTGEEGDNIASGWEILQGRKRIRDRWLSRLLVSSYQSYLCNRYLAERISRGLFGRLLLGDVAKKHDTGGLFIVESLEEQTRYEAGEISFTAPMVGYKMMRPRGDAAALEDEVLDASGLTDEQLRRCKAKGTRRMGRVFPQVSYSEAPEGVRLTFTLPTGAYATIILREFMKDTQFRLL